MVTMLFGCCNHREQVTPNPGHHHDIDPNEDIVAIVVGDKALQHVFHRTVQQSSLRSDNLAGRSEMHVVLQTVRKAEDDGVVKVVT